MNNNFKPGVDKKYLLFLAGALWLGVGSMLVTLACFWLKAAPKNIALLFGAIGIAAALIVHHFGFLKIVDKNLRRIAPMQGKPCVFSFMTWKSYLLVAIMASGGYLLRHSSLPKHDLAIIYIAIGLALVLSSVRYIRVLITQLTLVK